MTPVRLTLIGKPGCHLCDDARAVVIRVMERFADTERRRSVDIELDERSILDDASLARMHSEDIPVLLINDVRHAIWFIDEHKLAAAIEKAAKKRRLF